MSLEGDIRTALLAMDAVTALVGTSHSARIRPYKLDEGDDNTEEHIVIEVDSDDHLNDLTGRGGMVISDVNISCRAMTDEDARALAAAVRVNGTEPGTGLAGYGGSGTAFDAVLEDTASSEMPFDDGSDRAWYVVDQSYLVIDTETR